MNRYILIRRLRWPAILLLVGVVALLHQSNLTHFWGLFIPLLLILLGVLKLAERAALAMVPEDAFYPQGGFPGQAPGGYPAGYPGQQPYPYGAAPTGGAYQPVGGQPVAPQPAAPAQPGTAIVPTSPFDKPEGGQ